MIMGLDDWKQPYCREIVKERLLGAVREQAGGQVEALVAPPLPRVDDGMFAADDNSNAIGVPVAAFPRFMRCPWCNALARLDSSLFALKTNPFRPGQTRYIHRNCPKRAPPPSVLPARFLVACTNGHLDDFPWDHFVHRGESCGQPMLELKEWGVSGEAAEVQVECTTCQKRRRMSDAFGEEAKENLPPCTGRRPHLRDFEEKPCTAQLRAILLGASNSWFGVHLSALSLPVASGGIDELVDRHWEALKNVENLAVLVFLRKENRLPAFHEFSDAELMPAIERRRAVRPVPEIEAGDLKSPEWEVFSKPEAAPATQDFRLVPIDPPRAFAHLIEQVVLVERLREVSALIGFTRIDGPGNYAHLKEMPTVQRAPLSRRPPSIVPASEVRGEGLFIRLREEAVARWCGDVASEREGMMTEAHRRWRQARNISEPGRNFPGIRYVLVHSFAHALMRQLALECGYGVAALRERIYARESLGEAGAEAGVLIYTAAPDSEGTLGGLVSLGRPERLEGHLLAMMERAGLCASDPLCSEHDPVRDDLSLHGAACHACLFAPETSCERGNKYLDRATLVDTVSTSGLGFFERVAE
jgi:hypothetical protein